MGIGAKMIRGWLVLNALIDFFPLCISPNFLGAGPAFDMLATDIYPLATPPAKKGASATPIELGSFGARQVGYFFFLCGILRCLGGVNGAKDPTAALLAATSYCIVRVRDRGLPHRARPRVGDDRWRDAEHRCVRDRVHLVHRVPLLAGLEGEDRLRGPDSHTRLVL